MGNIKKLILVILLLFIQTPGVIADPSVFLTKSDAVKLLTKKIKATQSSLNSWEEAVRSIVDGGGVPAYSGCDIKEYLSLTYEFGGAAQKASTLALYSYLTSLHLNYGQEHLAQQASQLARKILLEWAQHGFTGLQHPSDFCDANGNHTLAARFEVGLQIARGMTHWVNAQDLLTAVNALDQSDRRVLDTFLNRLANIAKESLQERYTNSNLDCNRYGNHTSVTLAGIAAIAALQHDDGLLAEIAEGPGLGWKMQVTKAIYGAQDWVLNCYKNNEHPTDFYQTPMVKAGEIVDRFRSHSAQTFGYPMFSLIHLMLTADILQRNKFDVLAFRPKSQAPLKSAIEFYSLYYYQYLSEQQSFVPSSSNLPGAEQYVGKLVCQNNGITLTAKDNLLIPFLIGNLFYKDNSANNKLLCKALSFSSTHAGFGNVDSLFARYLGNLDAPCSQTRALRGRSQVHTLLLQNLRFRGNREGCLAPYRSALHHERARGLLPGNAAKHDRHGADLISLKMRLHERLKPASTIGTGSPALRQ